jgi:hypothetical protein
VKDGSDGTFLEDLPLRSYEKEQKRICLLSTETKTYSAIALKQTEIHDLVIEMLANKKHQLTIDTYRRYQSFHNPHPRGAPVQWRVLETGS